MPDYTRPSRATASSPILAPQPFPPPQPSNEVSVRPMRLKVLYTFDENKTNCLARWPHSLDIRTAQLDEKTQIGVIELKTCIHAIVTASPEIVAQLGQDYTVYAYDYSEYETPLVGQGMLSWVLASSSATPSAPAHQSRTMVTGRVSRNTLGLFSSNSQETLEVKLRLVPVPTSLQSEYLESMKKYRDISQMMPLGFDPQAWTSFLQANPGFLQQAMQSRSQSPAVGPAQPSHYGLEHVQRLLNGDVVQPRSVEERQPLSRAGSFANAETGQHVPRMPSPASSVHSAATAPKRRGRKPGPKPKARGKASVQQPQETLPESTDPGYGTGEERSEEGPRKRAKVTQAEWSGKQDFGKQPESLRVAASTAASVRIHQPTAVRPLSNPGHSLEPPPRAPTPIAGPSSKRLRPSLPLSKSNLGQQQLLPEKTYVMPYEPGVEPTKPPESAMTSPERSQAESSPPDIGSSPPVYRGGSTAPSSPNLPTPPQRFDDSGFMSGLLDDLFEDDETRSPNQEDFEIAAQYSKRTDLPTPSVEPMEEIQNNPPPSMALQPSELSEKAIAQSRQAARNATGSRLLGPTGSVGNQLPPQVPASDPIRPPGLNRSQTWAGNEAPHPASDVTPLPLAIPTTERPSSRGRRGSETGGSGVKRKAAIQSKLASSIAAGEMPPFCENCGAIETPTWRKAWVKIHSGTPQHVVLSEEEGGIIAWQTLQTDNKGIICLYRIIKKSLLKSDEGFTEILLCNPCGLWLHSRKCMRPKEVWEKPQKGPDDKRKRRPSGKGPGNSSMSNPATNDAFGAGSFFADPSSPANEPGQMDGSETEPQLPVIERRKASSVERNSSGGKGSAMDEASAAAALERAIQSSPHRFRGTKQVPIEVGDLTPQPTRRILFPSPTQSEKAKAKRKSNSGNPIQQSKQPLLDPPLTTQTQSNKENHPPQSDSDNQSFFDTSYHPPSSPTPTPPKDTSALLKTPTTTPRHSPHQPPKTDDFFSSAAKALFRPPPTTPSKRTPPISSTTHQPLGDLTPFTAHLNQLLSDANASPSSGSQFDFPALPSLQNTPGGGRAAKIIDDFDFSAFGNQDLISTDVPMPSSPPAWFRGYENGNGNGGTGGGGEGLWREYVMPGEIEGGESGGGGGEVVS